MVHEHDDPGCRPMSVLNLAGFLARSEVNGPGIRAVVWVQGCPLRCKGCFNPQFQSFSPASRIRVDELAEKILTLPDINGVTFSGGEPFAQAGPLAILGERLRMGGLTIVTYSGYTTLQLAAGSDPAWPALLAVTDLLITGPYVADLAVPDPLKGSRNQQVIPIGTGIALPKETGRPRPVQTMTEFTISSEGNITTTGFPASTLIGNLSSRCRGP